MKIVKKQIAAQSVGYGKNDPHGKKPYENSRRSSDAHQGSFLHYHSAYLGRRGADTAHNSELGDSFDQGDIERVVDNRHCSQNYNKGYDSPETEQTLPYSLIQRIAGDIQELVIVKDIRFIQSDL
jgi:hypothetical protein